MLALTTALSAHHDASPLFPQVHAGILDVIPRIAQFTKQARERAASGQPTVQRSSGPPPGAVPSAYGPPPGGMPDNGTRQQAQAGGIHPLEQVRDCH